MILLYKKNLNKFLYLKYNVWKISVSTDYYSNALKSTKVLKDKCRTQQHLLSLFKIKNCSIKIEQADVAVIDIYRSASFHSEIKQKPPLTGKDCFTI